MELDQMQLQGFTGGVLDDAAKDYIRKFIAVYKREGSDQNFLFMTGWSEEYMEYAMSVWNKVRV